MFNESLYVVLNDNVMRIYTQVPDVLTTSQGHPIDSKTSTLTIRPHGPVLVQDFTIADEMAHFDLELREWCMPRDQVGGR